MATLPPWLTPQAAQGYGDLAAEGFKTGATIANERARLAQEAAQHGMEMQQRQQEFQQKTAAEQEAAQQAGLVEQQKIQIDKATKDAELGLRQQDLALKQKDFEQQTQQAAALSAVQQQATKRIAAGEDPQKVWMELGPQMNMTSAALSKLITPPFKPGTAAQIPNDPTHQLIQTGPNAWHVTAIPSNVATNAPDEMPRTGGRWEKNPGTGKFQWVADKKKTGVEAAMDAYRASKGGTKTNTPAAKDLGTNEVIKVTKDGRKAVFDSKSKEFVRWADAPKETNASE
jgi:hypothetical protein